MTTSTQQQAVNVADDDNQILVAPPAPKLRARAAPADFQSFSMNQVEQALSSYGVGQQCTIGQCTASNCSISSRSGCISQNGSSSQMLLQIPSNEARSHGVMSHSNSIKGHTSGNCGIVDS